MSQETNTSAESSATLSTDKWCTGVLPDQPVNEVARCILEARLRAVWSRLPLAAEKSAEDVEHVHQLRVATRRAVESVRLFSTLIPREVCGDVRTTLRQIRLAADQARNWDVLSDMFLHCPDVSGAGVVCTIVEEIAGRRQAAQQPLVAMYRGLLDEGYHERIESLLAGLPSAGKHEAKRHFGHHARAYFKTVLKKFSQAAAADLSDDEVLHRFRICTKRIRYTMETVAVAFEPSFRKELYPQVSRLQDILGIVNDHAMGKVFFHDWSLRAHDAQEKAFLEGLVLAEARAQRDVRQAFSALWTPKSVAELLRQFDLHCGLS